MHTRQHWNPKGFLGKKEFQKQRAPNQEALFQSKLIVNRPDFIPLEFLLSKNGKRFLDHKTTRAMQSKISLKFPFVADQKEKPKMKPSVKAEWIS